MAKMEDAVSILLGLAEALRAMREWEESLPPEVREVVRQAPAPRGFVRLAFRAGLLVADQLEAQGMLLAPEARRMIEEMRATVARLEEH